MRAVRLILTFYRNFFLVSLIVTLLCMYSLHLNGLRAFFAAFVCKTLTLATFIYVVNIYKRKEYFYYQNLGVSKLTLWSSTLFIDYILFITLMIITYKCL